MLKSQSLGKTNRKMAHRGFWQFYGNIKLPFTQKAMQTKRHLFSIFGCFLDSQKI